jgi:D-alanyl-D-alanine endopeptidase (penicillin-binding protein 7)
MRDKMRWVLALAAAVALAAVPASAVHAAGKGNKAKPAKESRAAKPGKRTAKKHVASPRKSVAYVAPARPSFGQIYGLHRTEDDLALKSSVAYVIDQDTDEVLFSKNPQAVLPIASITKLMTALVVTEAALPLDEVLTVTQDDVAATSGSSSRLKPGTQLTRGEMLHLALMSSENRAAHVLGRTYPGGISAFIPAMNHKAVALGMRDTRYVEPTGLSADNQSSAKDLARLVKAAFEHPILRDFSTSPEAMVPVGSRQVRFGNTNGLVRNPEWEIGLQKTGYIAAAGRCVVMQAQLAGRKLIMVLLDSAGKYSRIGDAERIRKWLADSPLMPDALRAPSLRPASASGTIEAAGSFKALAGGSSQPGPVNVPVLSPQVLGSDVSVQAR